MTTTIAPSEPSVTPSAADALAIARAVYASGDPAAMLALNDALLREAGAVEREAERVRHRLKAHPDLQGDYAALLAHKHELASWANKLRRRAWRIERFGQPTASEAAP